MRTRYFSSILGFGALVLLLFSARPLPGQSRVKIDGDGVMVWEENGAEIQGFGVNYTLPFAFAYRNAKKLGLKAEQEIDRDLYHFSRLGFDLFRVHVWDTEISDTLGNLLSNEQLKLFDYMLYKMKAQGMRMVLTPIAFWGNGWPEPDEDTPGFSHKFGKDACLTNPEAIAAQERYLAQFLNHVNPYTKIAYKDDPAILAFEVSNEPHHREAPEQVTAFINRMIAAMRGTGCQKPVFYNISHSVHLADAYFKSDMQGGTFQWYPTGLGAQRELRGNLLPNVDRYAIPFASHPGFGRIAKYVYEFDAADVNRSYIYPAMARSFRQAGIQLATHFAYDPLYSAYANPEYNTHYMNLAYTPGKAIALMISGEVFRRVPRYADLGAYPDNARFGPFRVDYLQDLAELVADTVFYYTNSTPTPHPGPAALKRIAGVGSSSVVRYDGTGAYFLDQLQPGVWRLEVMPDALPFRNPFGRNSLDQEVTKINYRTWSMSVDLSDLGGAFKVTPMNQGNTHAAVVEGNTFAVRPGVYLLARNGIQPAQKPGDRFRYHTLGAYAAPKGSLQETYVIHEPAAELTADLPYTVEAFIATQEAPKSVYLQVFGPQYRQHRIAMNPVGGYRYRAVIPETMTGPGFLRYHIAVEEQDRTTTFPSGVPKPPYAWDFFGEKTYEVPVVPMEFPLVLFDALKDAPLLNRRWLRSSSLQPLPAPGEAELRIDLEQLSTEDPENLFAQPVHDYSMRFYFGDKTEGRKGDRAAKKYLYIKGRSLNDKPCKVQLALIQKDGSAFGGTVDLLPEGGVYRLDLTQLAPVPIVTLPRPYPTFLPYFFQRQPGAFSLQNAETLQISIGPGIPQEEIYRRHGMGVTRVWME
jgi:hypothetical protein